MTATDFLLWILHAVVGFAAGYALGLWRGAMKGYADAVLGMLDNKVALRNLLKGEVSRRGGLDAIARGVKAETGFFSSVIDEMLNRLETLRVSSMAAEYGFYFVLLVLALWRGWYLLLLGVPVCLMTVKQAVKERGEPRATEAVVQLFGIFHLWLRDHPVDAFNYAKVQKVPVRNITDLLRESGAYAL